MAAVRSLGAAHLRQPPVRLIRSEFDLRDVHGLSPRADYLRVLLDNMNWDVVESRCV